MLVEGDLAAVDAKEARNVVVQPGRILRADPDLGGLAVRCDMAVAFIGSIWA